MNFDGDNAAGFTFPNITVAHDTTGLAEFTGSSFAVSILGIPVAPSTGLLESKILAIVKNDYAGYDIEFVTTVPTTGPFKTWGIEDTAYTQSTGVRVFGIANGLGGDYARTFAGSLSLDGTNNPYGGGDVSKPVISVLTHTLDEIAQALGNSASHEIGHMFGLIHEPSDPNPKFNIMNTYVESVEIKNDKVFSPLSRQTLLANLSAPPDDPGIRAAIIFTASFTNEGLYSNNGDLIVVKPTGDFNGTGTYLQNDGSLIVQGNFEQTVINIGGGTARVEGIGAALTASRAVNIDGNGKSGISLNVSDGAILAAPRFNVRAGATLSGNGSIDGDVHVFDGGRFSPGNSPGVITINGNVFVGSGGTLIFEEGDFIDVDKKNGEVFIDKDAIIQLVFEMLPKTDEFFVIEDFFRGEGVSVVFGEGFNSDDSIQVFGTDPNFDGGRVYFKLLKTGDKEDILATRFFEQVPEPATLTIFGLGLAGLGLMRRRKRAA